MVTLFIFISKYLSSFASLKWVAVKPIRKYCKILYREQWENQALIHNITVYLRRQLSCNHMIVLKKFKYVLGDNLLLLDI